MIKGTGLETQRHNQSEYDRPERTVLSSTKRFHRTVRRYLTSFPIFIVCNKRNISYGKELYVNYGSLYNFTV